MLKTFDNLAQRCVNYFLVTMPHFKAVKSDAADENEQKCAYDFIKGIYEKLYNNPELLGLKNPPDDCYPEWWTKKNEKPGLPEKIRGNYKIINTFIETLYNIVQSGEENCGKISIAKDSIKTSMLKKLTAFGINNETNNDNCRLTFPKGVLKGLKLLAEISSEYSQISQDNIHDKKACPYFIFSHGIFDSKSPYTIEIFRGIFENKEAYDKIIDYFEKNDFIRLDNKEYSTGIKADKVSFDYLKFYGKPEGKIGNSWKIRNFSGIEISYNELTQSCTQIGVHIPFFSEILENADKMSDTLKKFVSENNKCGGCRYCVQTDKTKTKPLRTVKVENNNICTVFTFGYMKNHFYENTHLADRIIELMDFADKLFADRFVKNPFNIY